MAEISATMVKELRERTGAGIMDCKIALAGVGGDAEKAVEYIKKKGLAKAAKKAGAIAAEGVIHAYIHPGSRIGVLVEVNCQTDFVARSAEFKEFVELVGLQIASMNAAVRAARGRAGGRDSPSRRRSSTARWTRKRPSRAARSARPRWSRRSSPARSTSGWPKSASTSSPAITDEDKTHRRSSRTALSAKIGEKISVRRFVRYELGEGIEKKKSDFAAEVAGDTQGLLTHFAAFGSRLTDSGTPGAMRPGFCSRSDRGGSWRAIGAQTQAHPAQALRRSAVRQRRRLRASTRRPLETISAELAEVHALGVQLGDRHRRRQHLPRAQGQRAGHGPRQRDYMGMLATVINGARAAGRAREARRADARDDRARDATRSPSRTSAAAPCATWRRAAS